MGKSKTFGFFGKLLLWVNSLIAFLLLISFLIPYLSPKSFPTLSLLSLAVSPLLLANILFAIYWLVRMKKKFFISFLILVIAYFHFNPFYMFSSEEDTSEYRQTLNVLSYNVRLFNAYEKEPGVGIDEKMNALISENTPDIIGIQEYYLYAEDYFEEFEHQFVHFQQKLNKKGRPIRNNLGHAIFSKYPIVNKGGFDFDDSNNNVIWADIAMHNDTIRVYNMHLQSLGIEPRVSSLQKGDTKKLRARLAETFAQQEDQVAQVLAHRNESPFPVIMMGDMNNTPFSYIYRRLKDNLTDAFLEKGNGLGTTYVFDSYPMRIDYIFSDAKMKVLHFESVERTFSDHRPLTATLGWNRITK